MCILCFVVLGLLSLRWGNILKWPIEGFLQGERHECQATIRLNVEVNYPLDRLEAHERLFFSSDLHIPPLLSATPTLKKKNTISGKCLVFQSQCAGYLATKRKNTFI